MKMVIIVVFFFKGLFIGWLNVIEVIGLTVFIDFLFFWVFFSMEYFFLLYRRILYLLEDSFL